MYTRFILYVFVPNVKDFHSYTDSSIFFLLVLDWWMFILCILWKQSELEVIAWSEGRNC